MTMRTSRPRSKAWVVGWRCFAALATAALAVGCTGGAQTSDAEGRTLTDAEFAEMQERGASAAAMGIDQYTSTHLFDDLPDGGRIELQREIDDPAAVG